MAFRLGENILPHLFNKGENGDETTLTTTEIENALSLEKTRAETIENSLFESLNAEVQRATSAEDDEAKRAKDAEQALTENLNAEIARAKKAEADELARASLTEKILTENLSNEIERAIKAEADETSRAKLVEKNISENLAQEISERAQAILSEKEARENVESTIISDLNAEIARAKKAEADEKSLREEAETTLANNLNIEILARQEAIAQEVSDRNSAISAALDSLDSEDLEVDGQFVSKVVGENGKISVARKEFSNKVTSGDVNAPSGNAVYQALQALGTLYTLKGSVDDFDSLPTEVEAGWVYNAKDTGDNYVWTGTEWDKLGGTSFVDALNFADPKSNGQAVQFIDSISQTNGQISATKKEIPTALTNRYGLVKIADSIQSSEMSATHPALVKNYVDSKVDTEASNREIAISDAISTEVSNRNTAISRAIDALNVSDSAISGQYISSISEVDGLISIQRASLPTSLPASNTTHTYSPSSESPISGKGVSAAISLLDATATGLGASKTLASLSEEDGIISASFQDIAITKSQITDYSEYVLPVSTSESLGGVKSSTTGTTADRYYNVQVNSDGTMKVNVPWLDNDTKNTAGTSNSTSKLYLVGASTQSESAKTNSNSDVYTQDGDIYAKGTNGPSKVLVQDAFKYDATSGILTITI